MRRLAAAMGGAIIIALIACGEANPDETSERPVERVSLQGDTMGTTWTVQVRADALKEHDEQTLGLSVQAELNQVEQEMSHYRESSELSDFNRRREATWCPVSRAFADVVSLAKRIGAESDGAFDVTIGPLVDLWGFGPGSKAEGGVPEDAAIAAARELVGQKHLEARSDPPALRKAVPGLELNLSAIAKGHGVDRVADLLLRRGISDFLVEVGGEIRASGEKLPDTPWRVAIERPSMVGRELGSVIPLTNSSIATSGDYRNVWIEAGKRYSHMIDPRTGRPVTHTLASASVIADTCAEADAWATAMMILGPEVGLATAETHNLVVCFLVRESPGRFAVVSSTAFKTRFE